MKSKLYILIALLSLMILVIVGCTKASWDYEPIASVQVEAGNAPAKDCAQCHEQEHEAWADNKHSDKDAMAGVPIDNLKECGACHERLTAHLADAAKSTPPTIGDMSKTQQNALCGKCHFDIQLMGDDAINPMAKHSPIMSVGFDEGYKRQLSCLDCHSGHKGKGEMLQNIKAHVCFKCHKEAIVTMGIFQPFNYVTAGNACKLCHAPHGGTAGQLAGRMALGSSVCLPCHI